MSYVKGHKSFIAQDLLRNKKVLDMGCGFGDFLKYNPKRFEGVDINKDGLNFCRKKGYKVKNASVDKVPHSSGSFDAVVSLQVIEHLTPDLAYGMLKESSRVLKSGGLLVISTEMPTKKFWDTFSHIKPYTPKAIYKQISDKGQETFSKIGAFERVGIYYSGRCFKILGFLNFFSTLIANLLPMNRYNYTMILRKK